MPSDRNWRLTSGGLVAAARKLAISGATLAQERDDCRTLTQPVPFNEPAKQLLSVPVTGIYPGGMKLGDPVKNPFEGDPGAIDRGMKHFSAFNCDGCHAANGAGGMGPALSNNKWLHRSTPANIFLSIYQGRSNGMPAWGDVLPANVIWELVSYLQSISQDPDTHFGKTISSNPQSPDYEQVPVQELHSPQPWQHLQPFHNGQKP
jgi:cytochrome c oxidase cbb3-type subunit 3